jgi:hypothetical protein
LQPRKSAHKPKLQKEYAFLLPEKNCLKKIPSLLKNFKNADALPDRQNRALTITAKLNTDNCFQTRTTETPAYNTGLAAMAGDVVNSTFVHLGHL